ncbi:unnamed protein product [Amoebophrya sp. A25]|nr:unnamed protein product [Amoebophrya sp. A25]|eukprot:GSA25T00005435001.1
MSHPILVAHEGGRQDDAVSWLPSYLRIDPVLEVPSFDQTALLYAQAGWSYPAIAAKDYWQYQKQDSNSTVGSVDPPADIAGIGEQGGGGEKGRDRERGGGKGKIDYTTASLYSSVYNYPGSYGKGKSGKGGKWTGGKYGEEYYSSWKPSKGYQGSAKAAGGKGSGWKYSSSKSKGYGDGGDRAKGMSSYSKSESRGATSEYGERQKGEKESDAHDDDEEETVTTGGRWVRMNSAGVAEEETEERKKRGEKKGAFENEMSRLINDSIYSWRKARDRSFLLAIERDIVICSKVAAMTGVLVPGTHSKYTRALCYQLAKHHGFIAEVEVSEHWKTPDRTTHTSHERKMRFLKTDKAACKEPSFYSLVVRLCGAQLLAGHIGGARSKGSLWGAPLWVDSTVGKKRDAVLVEVFGDDDQKQVDAITSEIVDGETEGEGMREILEAAVEKADRALNLNAGLRNQSGTADRRELREAVLRDSSPEKPARPLSDADTEGAGGEASQEDQPTLSPNQPPKKTGQTFSIFSFLSCAKRKRDE